VKAAISKIVIKNFKSIGSEGVELELKPLTLLYGPQGAGKSSILEAIWRFANILLKPGPSITAIKDVHPPVDYKDLVYRKNVKNKLTIGIYTQYEKSEVGWIIENQRQDDYNLTTQWVLQDGHIIMGVGHKMKEGVRRPSLLYPRVRLEFVPSVDPEHLIPEVFKLLIPPSPRISPRKRIIIVKQSNLACNIIKAIIRLFVGQQFSKVALLTPLRGEISLYGDVHDIVVRNEELMSVGLKGEKLIQVLSTLMGDVTRWKKSYQ